MRPIPLALDVRNQSEVSTVGTASVGFVAHWVPFTPVLHNVDGSVDPTVASKHGSYIVLGETVVARYIIILDPAIDSMGVGGRTALQIPAPSMATGAIIGHDATGLPAWNWRLVNGYGNMDAYYVLAALTPQTSLYLRPLMQSANSQYVFLFAHFHDFSQVLTPDFFGEPISQLFRLDLTVIYVPLGPIG